MIVRNKTMERTDNKLNSCEHLIGEGAGPAFSTRGILFKLLENRIFKVNQSKQYKNIDASD